MPALDQLESLPSGLLGGISCWPWEKPGTPGSLGGQGTSWFHCRLCLRGWPGTLPALAHTSFPALFPGLFSVAPPGHPLPSSLLGLCFLPGPAACPSGGDQPAFLSPFQFCFFSFPHCQTSPTRQAGLNVSSSLNCGQGRKVANQCIFFWFILTITGQSPVLGAPSLGTPDGPISQAPSRVCASAIHCGPVFLPEWAHVLVLSLRWPLLWHLGGMGACPGASGGSRTRVSAVWQVPRGGQMA